MPSRPVGLFPSRCALLRRTQAGVQNDSRAGLRRMGALVFFEGGGSGSGRRGGGIIVGLVISQSAIRQEPSMVWSSEIWCLYGYFPLNIGVSSQGGPRPGPSN